MKKIYLLSLVLTVFNTQAQVVLSLDSCRELAGKNNYTLANASLTEQKANYEYKAVLSNYLPNISGFGYALFTNRDLIYNFSGAYLPTYVPDLSTGKLVPNLLLDPNGQMIIGPDGNPVFKQYTLLPPMELKVKIDGSYATGLKAVQPVFTGFKILTATKMAGIARKMASDNSDLCASNLMVQVEEAYWQLVRATELEVVATKYLETVKAVEKQVADANATGFTLNNDLLKVQVKVNEAQLMLSKAQNGHALAAMNLCNIIGLPISTLVIPDKADQENDIKSEISLIEGSIVNRPDYRLLDKQIEMKRAQVKLIRSDYLPHMGVAVTYGYINGLEMDGERLFNSANTSVIAQLSVPLFHWGEGYHKTESAKADLKIAENERDNLHHLMELEKEQYRFLLKDAGFRTQLMAKSLEQAAENVKVVKDRYELGLETITALLAAQAEWQKAWAEQIESWADYRITKIKYMKAAGNL